MPGVDTYTGDGVHPTPAGNALILDDLIDDVETLLAPFGKGDADPRSPRARSRSGSPPTT
ncbi:MAG: hypothetical protein R3D25_02015 [Geminicoccaceae bacterium]